MREIAQRVSIARHLEIGRATRQPSSGLIIEKLPSALTLPNEQRERTTALGLSEIRDIAVILLAIVSLIMALSLLLMVLAVTRLAGTIQQEIQPLLRSLIETINTVKGTTQFVSDAVVRPTAKAAGKTIGVVRFARALANAVTRMKKG